MTRRYHPHTVRHGARPPQSANAPGRSGQGERPSRPGPSPLARLAAEAVLVPGVVLLWLFAVAMAG